MSPISWKYVITYICTIHKQTHLYNVIHAHTYTHLYIRSHTQTSTLVHTFTHTNKHTCTSCVRTHTHTHTHTHVYIHIHAYRIDSDSLDDGHSYTPKSVFSWLTRVMYNRRTKINPLWNTVIVGGYHEEKPYVYFQLKSRWWK